MNLELRGVVIPDLTDDERAEVRRQLAIPDEEIDAALAQREHDAIEEAEVLDDQARRDGLIDASEAARRLGRSRDFVYDHADELGAIRIGDGPRPRLSFDPARISGQLQPRPSPPAVERSKPARRRRPSRARGELLKVRGDRP